MTALALHIPPADVWAMAPRDFATLVDVMAELDKARKAK
jgi:hypothetical protein